MHEAIQTTDLTHHYGDRRALDAVSLRVAEGSVFGLLGPNGGGKTTLFRILSTLLPVQQGQALVLGIDVGSRADAVRQQIGVTFQSPSLDPKLTVDENLRYHGALFGLSGASLRARIDELTTFLSIGDRRRDIAQTLSGGLKRRVEIAKSLLHQPRVLLLDEPSTGLDPGVRHELWKYLLELRKEMNVTILVTTHLLDEAEHCDRLALLDRGKIVAEGAPSELKAEVGGDSLTLTTADPPGLVRLLHETLQVKAEIVDGTVRLEQPRAHELVPALVTAAGERIETLTFGRPTLEDVFIQRTGRRIAESDPGTTAD